MLWGGLSRCPLEVVGVVRHPWAPRPERNQTKASRYKVVRLTSETLAQQLGKLAMRLNWHCEFPP